MLIPLHAADRPIQNLLSKFAQNHNQELLHSKPQLVSLSKFVTAPGAFGEGNPYNSDSGRPQALPVGS
jgi:hypothetical protein